MAMSCLLYDTRSLLPAEATLLLHLLFVLSPPGLHHLILSPGEFQDADNGSFMLGGFDSDCTIRIMRL